MADPTFGINLHGGALVEAVGLEQKIEKAVLKGSQGVDKFVKTFNPTTAWSLKTRGEPSALEVGMGDPGITGLEGGVTTIESIKFDETNTDFPSAEASGENHPDATAVA